MCFFFSCPLYLVFCPLFHHRFLKNRAWVVPFSNRRCVCLQCHCYVKRLWNVSERASKRESWREKNQWRKMFIVILLRIQFSNGMPVAMSCNLINSFNVNLNVRQFESKQSHELFAITIPNEWRQWWERQMRVSVSRWTANACAFQLRIHLKCHQSMDLVNRSFCSMKFTMFDWSLVARTGLHIFSSLLCFVLIAFALVDNILHFLAHFKIFRIPRSSLASSSSSSSSPFASRRLSFFSPPMAIHSFIHFLCTFPSQSMWSSSMCAFVTSAPDPVTIKNQNKCISVT